MNDRFAWQNHYPPGLTRAIEVPVKPAWTLLESAARRWPNRTAVYFRDVAISFERLWKHAENTAAQLRSRGYANAKRADRVLIWLPNCPEFVSAYYGALRAGCIVTCASTQLTAEELAAIMDDVDPKVAFVDSRRAIDFDAAVRRAGRKEPRTFYMTPGSEYTLSAADSNLMQVLLEPPAVPSNRPELDVAVLQYTSGTTGGVKAAMMSHRNLMANAMQNASWFKWTPNDVVLGALPLYHTWGMCCVMNSAIAAGSSMVLIEKFDPDAALDAIERHAVSIVYGSGTMFLRMLDAAGPDAARCFSSVRYVKAGAMLINAALPERWAATVPKVPMINGYGLTEAGPEVTNNPPQNVRPGTVGIPLQGTEVRLADPDDPEREMPPGEEGEVQVRGPQVMLGYWDNIDATREAFADGGWLRTGDLGAFDDEGYLRIVDRLKDLIKFRGYSVYPSEVEHVLIRHPAVAEAAVVGRPDPLEGEVPVAYLVLHPSADVDVSDMPRFLEPHLATYKRPKRFHVVHEIPKNHVGKPLKRVLREMPEPGQTGQLPRFK